MRPNVVAIVLSACLSGGLGGCTLVKGTLQLPDLALQALWPFSRQQRADPVEVQSKVIRFSDQYLEAVTRNMRALQRDGKPIGQRELTRRRIQYTNEVLAIATGSNAYANLLDMVVLVTLTRMRVDNYWRLQAGRADFGPIRKIFTESEAEIWRLSATVLAPLQQAELRVALTDWLNRNPKLRFTPDMADLDFVSEIRKFSRNRGSSAPASVFSLLMIDPLSGLDPAAKELAETRLLAERALFLSRHLPELIRWESEYFTLNTMDLPEIGTLLGAASKLSESAEHVGQLAQQMPEFLGSEREQLIATLKSERQGLTVLAAESRQALTAGKQMAESAQAALQSFRSVLAELNTSPRDPNAEPFRIADYTAAAAQMAQTSDRLAELLGLFNRTIATDNAQILADRVALVTREAATRGRDLVDYAYRKLLIASALIGAMTLGFALAYQVCRDVLSRVLSRGGRGHPPIGGKAE